MCGILVAEGCASTAKPPERGDVIRQIMKATVQLTAERQAGGRRAGSGVVIGARTGPQRTLILTTRHFLDASKPDSVAIRVLGRKDPIKAVVVALSRDADLAIVEAEGITAPSIHLKVSTQLGDEIWVVGFPWGRRVTLVSGVVSQIVSEDAEFLLEGPVKMVDAPVSYGVSGGGVFDSVTGALVGLVEGYRTAQVAVSGAPDRVLQVPVPGETNVIPAPTILRFLETVGLGISTVK